MQPQPQDDQLDAQQTLTIVLQQLEWLKKDCNRLEHARKITNNWLQQFGMSSCFAMLVQNGTSAGEIVDMTNMDLLVTEFAERAQQMLGTRLSCAESAASAAADRARKAASEAALSARAALKAKVDATQQAVAASASAEMLQASVVQIVSSLETDVHQHHHHQRHHHSSSSSTEEAAFQ